MAISKYQKERNLKLKKKALALYKKGFTLRQIESALGEYTYEWYRNGIKELTGLDTGSRYAKMDLAGVDKQKKNQIKKPNK